jgi:hypothetical protein
MGLVQMFNLSYLGIVITLYDHSLVNYAGTSIFFYYFIWL